MWMWNADFIVCSFFVFISEGHNENTPHFSLSVGFSHSHRHCAAGSSQSYCAIRSPYSLALLRHLVRLLFFIGLPIVVVVVVLVNAASLLIKHHYWKALIFVSVSCMFPLVTWMDLSHTSVTIYIFVLLLEVMAIIIISKSLCESVVMIVMGWCYHAIKYRLSGVKHKSTQSFSFRHLLVHAGHLLVHAGHLKQIAK